MLPIFKLVVNGGRLNGAERYYKSEISAIRAAYCIKRADERCFQFDSYFEIFSLVKVSPIKFKRVFIKTIG